MAKKIIQNFSTEFIEASNKSQMNCHTAKNSDKKTAFQYSYWLPNK